MRHLELACPMPVLWMLVTRKPVCVVSMMACPNTLPGVYVFFNMCVSIVCVSGVKLGYRKPYCCMCVCTCVFVCLSTPEREEKILASCCAFVPVTAFVPLAT